MDKMAAYPPAYEQSQSGSNPGYSGPEPAYPPGYPQAQDSFSGHGQGPGTVFLTATRPPGSSVHFVTATNSSVPVMMAHVPHLGPHPCTVQCPQCRTMVTSQIRKEPGLLAWMSCGFLSIIGCIFGCCLIPFCIDGCKDVYHTCPNCKTYLGKYSRLR